MKKFGGFIFLLYICTRKNKKCNTQINYEEVFDLLDCTLCSLYGEL